MFTKSGALYLVINSSFFLILHCSFSFVGQYIFLSTFSLSILKPGDYFMYQQL
jgi:hypothetical protein